MALVQIIGTGRVGTACAKLIRSFFDHDIEIVGSGDPTTEILEATALRSPMLVGELAYIETFDKAHNEPDVIIFASPNQDFEAVRTHARLEQIPVVTVPIGEEYVQETPEDLILSAGLLTSFIYSLADSMLLTEDIQVMFGSIPQIGQHGEFVRGGDELLNEFLVDCIYDSGDRFALASNFDAYVDSTHYRAYPIEFGAEEIGVSILTLPYHNLENYSTSMIKSLMEEAREETQDDRLVFTISGSGDNGYQQLALRITGDLDLDINPTALVTAVEAVGLAEEIIHAGSNTGEINKQQLLDFLLDHQR